MTITPKVLGGDFELANALETQATTLNQSVYEASRRLLDEIDGYPRMRMWGGTSIEWGRRFMLQEGSELASARDFAIPHCVNTIEEAVALIGENRAAWLESQK